MKVVWIGAGNLATQLGVALARAGHETLQVFSRTEASASALSARLHCAATNRVEDILTGADVYVFSLKDSVLEELVARIAPRIGQALCIHTAGSMPMDVFRGHAAHYGVCYPMQSFSRTVDVDFREIPCFVEASDEASLAQVRQLAESVSGRVMEMSTAKRRYLHLAAVFACNFANHCYALSAEVLEKEGIPFDVMLPLIDETARKVHRIAPREAQTGPAVRYDRNVIDKQMDLLADDEGLQGLYGLMSQSIHRLALQNE